MTRKKLIDLIIVRLTAGMPSDDFPIDDRQIGSEIDIAASKLLNDAGEKIKIDDTYEALYVMFDGIEITEQTINTNMDTYQTKYYVLLPCQPVTLQNDMGIKMVETSGGHLIKRAKLLDKKLFCHLPFSKADMTYTRIQNKLYLDNITKIFADNGHVNVVMAISTSLGNLASTEDYPIPTYLLEPLVDTVVDRLTRQLGMPIDKSNDGTI